MSFTGRELSAIYTKPVSIIFSHIYLKKRGENGTLFFSLISRRVYAVTFPLTSLTLIHIPYLSPSFLHLVLRRPNHELSRWASRSRDHCGPGGVRSRAAFVPTRGSGTRPHETISEDPELVISTRRDVLMAATVLFLQSWRSAPKY